MFKFTVLTAVLWLLLFSFRVVQIGGIDPTFRDNENELLKPLRESLSTTINEILPAPQSGLLAGILIGTQENLPFSLKTQLKNTSTIHMVVVSGQNLSILAGFLAGFVYLIGRRKTIVLTLLALIFYSLLTGLQVPVIRASIMVLSASAAQLLGKENSGFWSLLLTAGLMLVINPNWILSISFQLSFLATFGVVVAAPLLEKYLKQIPRILRQDLATTFCAQILVLPVLAYNFQQLSLVGVLSNLLILWTIPIIMVTGFISLAFGLISTVLGQVIGLIPSVLLTYFIDIVQIFAKIPGASLQVGESSLILWVGYYLMIVGGIWILKIKNDQALNSLKGS